MGVGWVQGEIQEGGGVKEKKGNGFLEFHLAILKKCQLCLACAHISVRRLDVGT